MLGSNNYGQAYYGQGAAVETTFVLKSLSATVTTTANISFVLLITKTLSASVTTTASLTRQVGLQLSASVSTLATIASSIVKALNVRRASTKILTLANTTRGLDGHRDTKELNLITFTKDTTDD